MPPEPNMRLPPQQVLAVAIGNCRNIKVQTKHVQTHKIMSRGPISFSEWVGVWANSAFSDLSERGKVNMRACITQLTPIL